MLIAASTPRPVSYRGGLTREDPAVQAHARKLMEVAHQADDIYMARIDPKPIEEYVGNISDKQMLLALSSGFKTSLENETQSTYRSGSMAGSRCNMMRIYGTIVRSLDARLRQMQGE